MTLKLTVLIPTFNRAERVNLLVQSLKNLFRELDEDMFEIVISDNHSSPTVLQTLDSALVEKVKIVIPDRHLETAEENLAFAISFCSGKFIWVHGDDDGPLRTGVATLLTLVNEDNFDLAIFNSKTKSDIEVHNNITRLKLNCGVAILPLTQFIRQAGFWSIPAGFSTLLFRREYCRLSVFEELFEQNIFIYSHVTFLLKSFYNRRFILVNEPLVEYNTNPFDNDTIHGGNKSSHWLNYAERKKRFYGDPWTYSFLRQIEYLKREKILTFPDLWLMIDQGHIGHRFFLAEQILSNYIEQVITEAKDSENLPMNTSEKLFISNALQQIHPKIGSILERVSREEITGRVSKLEKISLKESSSTRTLIHRKWKAKAYFGYFMESPYGFLWNYRGFDVQLNLKSLTTPSGAIKADSKENLYLLVARFIDIYPHSKNLYRYFVIRNFLLSGRLRLLARYLPKSLKRYIRKALKF